MAGEPPPKAPADDDMGDGMQCSNHPYTSNPGGICAFCLQEKLGKLVSSSSTSTFPLSVPSSSSSPPSFRSDHLRLNNSTSNAASAAATSLALSVRPCTQGVRRNDPTNNGSNNSTTNNSSTGQMYNEQHYSKAKIPFLLARRKKKIMAASSSSTSSSENRDVVFKRSKSTAAPGRRSSGHFFDDDADGFSPRKRRGGFWSFLYHSASSSSNSKSNSNISKRIDHHKVSSLPAATASSSSSSPSAANAMKKERCLGGSNLSRRTEMVAVEEEKEGEEEDSPNSHATADSVTNSAGSSFERKVSRSRSVGCGSRSFSGDLFEKLSTGFGDCALRRVESQREGGKHRVSSGMKDRVKCGGIFGGFIITSSSSSSSSAYWVSEEMSGKSAAAASGGNNLAAAHGRTRSWTWAFASPMRAFNSKPSAGNKDGKRETGNNSNKNSAPNLAAIPSLLTVNS